MENTRVFPHAHPHPHAPNCSTPQSRFGTINNVAFWKVHWPDQIFDMLRRADVLTCTNCLYPQNMLYSTRADSYDSCVPFIFKWNGNRRQNQIHKCIRRGQWRASKSQPSNVHTTDVSVRYKMSVRRQFCRDIRNELFMKCRRTASEIWMNWQRDTGGNTKAKITGISLAYICTNWIREIMVWNQFVTIFLFLKILILQCVLYNINPYLSGFVLFD